MSGEVARIFYCPIIWLALCSFSSQIVGHFLLRKAMLTEKELFYQSIRLTAPSSIIGVYFLFREETLVYIGGSLDCENRIYSHLKDKTFSHYSIVNTLPEDRFSMEDDYIFKFAPIYNIKQALDCRRGKLRKDREPSNNYQRLKCPRCSLFRVYWFSEEFKVDKSYIPVCYFCHRGNPIPVQLTDTDLC